MKNILVPVGDAKNSLSNLQYAVDLAREFDANVYAVAVFQEISMLGNTLKENEDIKKETEQRLQEVINEIDHKDVSIIAHPLKGGIVEGVNRFATHVPIDLMVLSPRSNAVSDEIFLGNTSGMLLKGTDIPILIVPEGEKFKKPASILMAFKRGNFRKRGILKPIENYIKRFDTKLHVLHVETPEGTEEMKKVSDNLKNLQSSYKVVQSATTFQAVLEYIHVYEPDMVCVVRRKRGFFKLLIERNVILKKEFNTTRPLLVLKVQE